MPEEELKPAAGASPSIHIGAATGVDEGVKIAKPTSFRKKRGMMEEVNAYLARFTKVKATDLVSFFRLLATMINAGISITKSLNILKDQTKNANLQRIIDDLQFRIENGASFSQAMKNYPEVFNEAQIGMVESGEATGRLNQTLLQIASETEKSAQLTKKIKGAMIYPAVVILILFAALYLVMTLVMPQVKGVFDSLGGELPGSTLLLIAISDFLVAETAGIRNGLWLILVLFGLTIAVMQWKKTKSGREIWTRMIMRAPVFGRLLKLTALARFCRSLSTLINSGVSIVRTLYITSSSVGNPLYEKRVKLIADDVKRGITMGENIKDDERFFPPMVVGMINVAEQTAQVDVIAGKLADFYEDEVDNLVRNLTSLLEPIIIVLLGTTVGFLVISVMLPILQASDLAFAGS